MKQKHEIEFLEALKEIGISRSLCESINDIRRAIFEGEEEPSGKKYELTDETMEVEDSEKNIHTLHRIKSLKEIEDIKVGDLGGWIESEKNLNQEGECWVYDDSKVYGNASVSGDANVYDGSEVRDNAQVYDTANVARTNVSGDAKIYGNAWVYGYDDAIDVQTVYKKGEEPEDDELVDVYADDGHEPDYHIPVIRDNVEIYDDAEVIGSSVLSGNVKIHGDVMVTEADIDGDLDFDYQQDLDDYVNAH